MIPLRPGSGVRDATAESPDALATRLAIAAGGKHTNPKDALGAAKLPLDLVPSTIQAYASVSFAEGALKYGKYNWRAIGVRASIYTAAAMRHLQKWHNGEERDPETNVPHLASVIACVGIILDARHAGRLNDDRPPACDMAALERELTGVFEHLRGLHADKTPKHWTIADELPEWVP